ncbi:MAG: aldehyde-activating protein [Candidatus Pelagibacter sp. TMED275]|nr:MAG: aldehyde-activating protein [Candidatus Pelagibacter sp. TMED275]|tara:strand:+ start:1191 stop:1562 length:372 start_codon:yes stop_codon:yes gene_type:complete
MVKKLTCHCKEVELEVKEPEGGFNKFLRCNCTLCERKGYIMTFAPITDVKILKGKDKLSLYQYHTNVAEHYFCSICGIYTHHKMRSKPDVFGLNSGCIEGLNSLELQNVSVNDGQNHPLDQKK